MRGQSVPKTAQSLFVVTKAAPAEDIWQRDQNANAPRYGAVDERLFDREYATVPGVFAYEYVPW